MKRLTIGIVDYGAGNLASVRHALHAMGYRSRASTDRDTLAASDLLLIPGVGAFPAAMSAMHAQGLVDFIRALAQEGKPILGICLGMQLLAESSSEWQFTAGMGLIPGEVLPLAQANWHIGWNGLEVVTDDPLFTLSDGQAVYFNHSYVFNPPPEYRVAVARLHSADEPFTVAVRRRNVVGLQFHPEKSQTAGRQLLAKVIDGLCHA